MSGRAIVVIHPSIYTAVAEVATILETGELDSGLLSLRIETDLLPDGFHGVMNAVVNPEGKVIRFERDMDT